MLGRDVGADGKEWGLWATTAWVAAALVLKELLFPRREHLLLDGTASGRGSGYWVWVVPRAGRLRRSCSPQKKAFTSDMCKMFRQFGSRCLGGQLARLTTPQMAELMRAFDHFIVETVAGNDLVNDFARRARRG